VFAINELRNRLYSDSKEMIVPFPVHMQIEKVKFTIPKRGDKLKLLELSTRNAKMYMLERKKQKMNAAPLKAKERILETLKSDLRMKVLPRHIECFDNSNIQGTNPVAACVVFKNTLPLKKEYRHYNIKTVKGANDFASMEEVVYRRYSRLLKEEKDLPDLIIIDGGKGQLNAAVNSLDKLKLRGKISIIGIAKRLEEIYFPDDPVPLYIDKNSESLKVIQNLRNEAHRFGINFHRQKRSKGMIESSLEKISGIGSTTIKSIVDEFGSVENVKKVDFAVLAKKIGKKKAEIVWKAIKNHKQ